MSETEQLRSLYAALGEMSEHAPVAAALGRIITRLGDQLFPPGKENIGQVAMGANTYLVDRSDRFGRACYFGASQEQADLTLFSRLCRAGDIVWDIGSNFGLYAIGAGRVVGPEGKVIAIEPNEPARSLLRQNAEQNGVADTVVVLDCAVSNEDGSAQFFEAADSAFSGLSDTKRSRVNKTTTVEVRTVESLSARYNLDHFDLMKVDVEGFEIEVLEGARPVLENSPNAIVQFEVSVKNLTEDRAIQLLTKLRAFENEGYRFFLGPTRSRPLAHLDLTNDDILTNMGGNWFMCRDGSDRQVEWEQAGALLFAELSVPRSQDVSPLVTALNLVVADSNLQRRKLAGEVERLRDRAAELEKQGVLNLWNETRLRSPPLAGSNLALRPLSLAKVTSVSLIVRLSSDDNDLEGTIKSVARYCGNLLSETIVVDQRKQSARQLSVPDEALFIQAGRSDSTAAFSAALGAAKASHLLVIDAGRVIKPTVKIEALLARWQALASGGNRVGALAFLPSSRWTSPPWTTEQPLTVAYEGLFSGLALSLLKAGVPRGLSELGLATDISLQLADAGFAVESANLDVIEGTTRAAMTVVLGETDSELLSRRWRGFFVPNVLHSIANKTA